MPIMVGEVFCRAGIFLMASSKDGWARPAKNLKVKIDEEFIEAYQGKVFLPFKIGDN
ncbi:MAG: hypothetical protein SWO11_04285 [Thermodesulfobacteriota bacterium]|nr:hypothetical protein [Thermodesulfobacteriota bacterium]